MAKARRGLFVCHSLLLALLGVSLQYDTTLGKGSNSSVSTNGNDTMPREHTGILGSDLQVAKREHHRGQVTESYPNLVTSDNNNNSTVHTATQAATASVWTTTSTNEDGEDDTKTSHHTKTQNEDDTKSSHNTKAQNEDDTKTSHHTKTQNEDDTKASHHTKTQNEVDTKTSHRTKSQIDKESPIQPPAKIKHKNEEFRPLDQESFDDDNNTPNAYELPAAYSIAEPFGTDMRPLMMDLSIRTQRPTILPDYSFTSWKKLMEKTLDIFQQYGIDQISSGVKDAGQQHGIDQISSGVKDTGEKTEMNSDFDDKRVQTIDISDKIRGDINVFNSKPKDQYAAIDSEDRNMEEAFSVTHRPHRHPHSPKPTHGKGDRVSSSSMATLQTNPKKSLVLRSRLSTLPKRRRNAHPRSYLSFSRRAFKPETNHQTRRLSSSDDVTNNSNRLPVLREATPTDNNANFIGNNDDSNYNNHMNGMGVSSINSGDNPNPNNNNNNNNDHDHSGASSAASSIFPHSVQASSLVDQNVFSRFASETLSFERQSASEITRLDNLLRQLALAAQTDFSTVTTNVQAMQTQLTQAQQQLVQAWTMLNVTHAKDTVNTMSELHDVKTDVYRLHALLTGSTPSGQQSGQDRVAEVREETRAGVDCAALARSGVNASGVYDLQPDPNDNRTRMTAFCDMRTDGGGWTVFQRRRDGSDDFFRGWSSYKHGFGSYRHDHWLGLENIHLLTKYGDNVMRIELIDWDNETRWAEFSYTRIMSESDGYRILVGGYRGNSGDPFHSLSYDMRMQSMRFSTFDSDNDMDNGGNCALTFTSGWWFNKCFQVNLNGVWYGSSRYAGPSMNGIVWDLWPEHFNGYSLKQTEMKLRPAHFQRVDKN